jgi:DNA-binding LacI/PurR family transcriptional regulator
VTRADVASRANVSAATVSYVLNDVKNQTISEATRKAVRRAAEELGYRPNLAARNLAAGASGVVLHVLRGDAQGELPVAIGSGLSTALARHGIVLSLHYETGDTRAMAEVIANLRPIAVTSLSALGKAASAAVTSAGIPEIHIGTEGVRELEVLHLAVGETQVAHLTSQEHRRLAFAFSSDETLRSLGDLRLAGVRAACELRGLPEPLADTLETDGSNAANVVAQWLNNGITAVCAYNDETAFILLHGLRQLGLCCPDDLAVIGIDANPIGYVSDPPLTTVAFDTEAIIKLAVAGLLEALGYPSGETSHREHLVKLIERDST